MSRESRRIARPRGRKSSGTRSRMRDRDRTTAIADRRNTGFRRTNRDAASRPGATRETDRRERSTGDGTGQQRWAVKSQVSAYLTFRRAMTDGRWAMGVPSRAQHEELGHLRQIEAGVADHRAEDGAAAEEHRAPE